LEPQGKITEEATMFPLEDDPTEQAITYRSCLTGIIMAIIGSAVGLVSYPPFYRAFARKRKHKFKGIMINHFISISF
jgi:hypothetical protein